MRLVIRQYRRLSPRLFEKLYLDLAFPEGGFRAAMEENRMERCWVAFVENEIVGWSGVYRGLFSTDSLSGLRSVGVWVIDRHRHGGVGGKLRRKAMLWSLRQRNETAWYDCKDNWQAKFCNPCELKDWQNDMDARRLEGTSERLFG